MFSTSHNRRDAEDPTSPRQGRVTPGKLHLPKSYSPRDVEDRIYAHWEESGAFRAESNSPKEPFTISMPPPNATGQLHLGHAVMLALEDIFCRFARMCGKEALWVPGTDHAAIATNAIIERQLLQEGKTKHEIGREEFLRRVQEYIAQSQGTIRGQIRKMGASCDWSRERYTMDLPLARCTFEVFKDMVDRGVIYRGERIVNWCPRCHSTLSDDEVEYEEREEQWYTIRYGPLCIGTARPETKFGDTAVAVHPQDERYGEYVGKEIAIETAIGPATIRVIADPVVDASFGTGAVKVTPAHDFVDFEMAQRHGIPVRQVIDEDGRMMAAAGPFAGMTTRECREAMVEQMRKKGILISIEPYRHNLSLCYRCHSIIEPLPKLQWFVDVNRQVIPWKGKSQSLKEVLQDVVHSGMIRIIPAWFEKTYFQWIDHLRDWCISRQIWWGHRIPVYYCRMCCGEGQAQLTTLRSQLTAEMSRGVFVSIVTLMQCPRCGGPVEQDPDTLDTWYGVAQWTWSTLVDPVVAADSSLTLREILERSQDFQRFHPTTVMETGYDILFFWVARMILMTTYTLSVLQVGRDESERLPFRTVYLHGLVRTREGKKMSKSHPKTCIDPLEMIRAYGADALRLSMIVGQSPGNDFRLYREKIAGYRNFVNKLWNASRFVLLECEKRGVDPAAVASTRVCEYLRTPLSLTDRALLSELQQLIRDVTGGLEEYRLSEVGERLYSFLWDYFCDWYLELSKGEANLLLVHALRTLLILLHPYCPFVTEELWAQVKPSSAGMLMREPWPTPEESLRDADAEEEFRVLVEVISTIRSLRNEYDVDPLREITAVLVTSAKTALLESQQSHIRRLARVGKLTIQDRPYGGSKAVSSFTCHVEVHVPLEDLLDMAKERSRLRGERERLEKFLARVRERLGDEQFLQSAPAEVVEKERRRAAEMAEKVGKIEEKLRVLG